MSRKTCRSIRDHLPTMEEVLDAGDVFSMRYWNKAGYPGIASGVRELGLEDGQRVTRADVFEMVGADPRMAVMLTVVWGYREGKINRHRAPVEAIFRSSGCIADGLRELQNRQPLPARDLIGGLNKLCGSGVSTSTTSKLAYFFGLMTEEGACAIYDHQVIATIMEGTHREFRELRKMLPAARLRTSRDIALRLENARTSNRQLGTYAAYTATVNRVARRLSQVGAELVTPGQVELALFDNVPGRGLLGSRTSSSKEIQARTARRKLARAIKNIDAAEPQAA